MAVCEQALEMLLITHPAVTLYRECLNWFVRDTNTGRIFHPTLPSALLPLRGSSSREETREKRLGTHLSCFSFWGLGFLFFCF